MLRCPVSRWETLTTLVAPVGFFARPSGATESDFEQQLEKVVIRWRRASKSVCLETDRSNLTGPHGADSDKASEGYRAPPTRTSMGTPSAGGSRLGGVEDTAEEEAQEEQGIDRKKRKERKKKTRRESEKDDHGIYRFEDGKIDHKKMPPMGG